MNGEEEKAIGLANRIMDLLDNSGDTPDTQILALVMTTAIGGRTMGMTPEMLKNAMVAFLTPQPGEMPANVIEFRAGVPHVIRRPRDRE